MAPSTLFVVALFRVSSASMDEQSLLQMPHVQGNVANDDSGCRCPGYFEEECTANEDKGCLWHPHDGSNAAWCGCDEEVWGALTPPIWGPAVTIPPETMHCSSNEPFMGAITVSQNDLVGGANLAAQPGAVPFGSSSLPGHCENTGAGAGAAFGGQGIHCFDNVNDGQYGNSHSWIPGGPFNGKFFVGVSFDGIQTISAFSLARDRTGVYPDRTEGSYELQYTMAANPTYDTPDSEWCSAGTFTRNTPLLMGFQLSENVRASAVRVIVSDPIACIDELEIY